MKNNVNLSTLSPELQKAIKKEVSALKTQAQKKPLSDLAEVFLDTFVKGTWTQREDGKIDVKGRVKLKKGPLVERVLGKEIFFGKVSGNFDCSFSGLTSLEGCPEEVGKDFWCDSNNLTSLKGAPKEVGGHFICNSNNLTSLEGAPEKVEGGFYCARNKLTSLKGAPEKVEGGFYCVRNKLTSLEGAPEVVGGDFNCAGNKLTSLEGIGVVKGEIISDLKA